MFSHGYRHFGTCNIFTHSHMNESHNYSRRLPALHACASLSRRMSGGKADFLDLYYFQMFSHGYRHFGTCNTFTHSHMKESHNYSRRLPALHACASLSRQMSGEKADFWTCNIFRCFHMDTGTLGLVTFSHILT